MWKILTLIIFVFLFVNSQLHSFLAVIIRMSHDYCLHFAPANSPFQFLYQAMVCGEPPRSNTFITDLKSLGLYHLLVVSGSHFILLEYLLTPLSRRLGHWGHMFSFVILVWFALICMLAAPVLRALISFMLRKLNAEAKTNWQGHHIALFSGLVTLVIYPEWLNSLSFILSWGAALLTALPIRQSLSKHMVIFIGLLPLVFTLQPMSPMVGLCNWILAPILGVIMLPACLLCFVITPLSSLVDLLWSAVQKIFHLLANELSYTQTATTLSLWGLWLYIFFLHLSIHAIEREKARK